VQNWKLNTLSGKIESRDQTFAPKLIADLSGTYKFNNHDTII